MIDMYCHKCGKKIEKFEAIKFPKDKTYVEHIDCENI